MTEQARQHITLALSAFSGACLPVLYLMFYLGEYKNQTDVNTREIDYIKKHVVPLVFQHDAILSQKKTVAPPAATLSRYKYEALPSIPFTEWVPNLE